METLDPEYSK